MAEGAESRVVSCDGNSHESGHPLIYMNLGETGKVKCPYCGHVFVAEKSPHPPIANNIPPKRN